MTICDFPGFKNRRQKGLQAKNPLNWETKPRDQPVFLVNKVKRMSICDNKKKQHTD